MGKKLKSFVLLSALFALCACNNTEKDSNSVSGSQSTQGTSSSISTPDPIEVTKKFALTVNAAEGTKVELLENVTLNEIEAGTTLTFKVTVTDESKELSAVKFNGKFVSPVEGNTYEVMMPNQNTTLETEVIRLGDASLINVSDVNEEALPTTVEELKDVLTSTVNAESKYLANATYHNTMSGLVELNAEVGRNDVVVITGQTLDSDYVSINKFSREEKGLVNNRFYTLKTTSNPSSGVSTTGSIKQLVEDDTETLLGNQIKESDAKLQVGSADFISNIINFAFSATSSESFLSNKSYGWTNVAFESKVDEDKKTYTSLVTAYYSYSSASQRMISLKTVIDGDNFLRSAEFLTKHYSDIDFDKELKQPLEGAEPSKVEDITIQQTRGYRHTLNQKTDLNQHVMKDYNVNVNYKLPGEKEIETTNNKVANSATLSFKFRHKDNHPVMITPQLVGAKEEGFIEFEDEKPVVKKEGNFHLIFDNGLGEQKEVAVESFRPEPSSISATMSAKIYKGEFAILTVTVLPDAADKNVEVTLASSSECQVEITRNEDGTFNVKGIENGFGTLEIKSTIKASVSTTVNFDVMDKPDVNAIKANLTSKTLFGKVSGWGSHFVNLNEDGTGQYVCFEGGKGDVIPFTWTLNEATIEFEIEVDGTLKSKYYTFMGLIDPLETGLTLVFGYNGSPKQATMTLLDDKLDFATADLSSY